MKDVVARNRFSVKDLCSRLGLFALLLALISLMGCSALEAGPHHAAAGPDGLAASSATIDMGTVVVGSNAAVAQYIYNPTASKIIISQVSSSNGDFQITSRALPIVLYPNQGTRLVVTYTPRSAGNSSATLIISNSARQHALTVPVSGRAIPAGRLVVSPASMLFGSITLGKNASQPGTLTNDGGTSVTVSQAATNNADFALSGITFPVVLQPHQSAQFAILFAPKASGTRSGNIAVSGSASLIAPTAHTARNTVYMPRATSQNKTANMPVKGVGAQPKSSDAELGQLTATPASLSFGSPQVGSTQSKSFIVTNSGTGKTTISQIAPNGSGYSVNGPALPLTLAGNQTASFTVTFAPQTAGTANGNITVASDAANKTLTVGLSGTAVTKGLLSVNASPVSFGTVQVGDTDTATATITNTGGSNVTVSRATVSGSAFKMNTMGMPMTLAPNQSMRVNLTCAPNTAGSMSGSLNVVSDASNADLAVPLTASAVAAGTLTASPTSLSFGSVQTGKTQSKSATVTNSGGSSITITQAAFTGSGYSLTGLTLPATLQAGQSASFNVVFAPQSAAVSNSSLTLTSDASNPTLAVSLTGTGVTDGQLAAGTASLNFGNVTVGQTKTLQETLTNSGGMNLILTQVAAGGGYSVNGLNLPMTLAPSQSTSFSVVFAPQSGGNSNVNLVISNDGSSPTLNIPLSGTGVTQGALTINPISFGSVQVGSTSTKAATLTNSGGSSITVSQAVISGAGFNMTGLTPPLTLTAGQSLTFNVTFAPQSAGTASGSIAFSSDAATSPTVALSATGTAVGQLAVSPGNFSFGSVTVGSSKNLSATLSASSSSVTVTSASVSSSEFSISGPSLPLTIQPGNNASFTLTFTPQASGTATANVSFATNAGSPVNGTLTGTGSAPVQHSVSLSWNASSSSVAGYNIYRAGSSTGPFSKVNSSLNTDTSYVDQSVQGGQTYYYATTAVDGDGLESSYSNLASAAVPTP